MLAGVIAALTGGSDRTPLPCGLERSLVQLCLSTEVLSNSDGGLAECMRGRLQPTPPCRSRKQRKLKAQALRLKLQSKRLKLIVGAGSHLDICTEWLCSDRDTLDLFKLDDWLRLFGSVESVDAIFAEHVLEHLTPTQVSRVASAAYLFLKPGGRFRVAVPDGYLPDLKYQQHVRIGGTPSGLGDSHMSLWSTDNLPPIFANVGFRIMPREHWTADGTFFQAADAYVDDVVWGVVRRSQRHDRAKPRREGAAEGLENWHNQTMAKGWQWKNSPNGKWALRAVSLQRFTSLWFDAVKPTCFKC